MVEYLCGGVDHVHASRIGEGCLVNLSGFNTGLDLPETQAVVVQLLKEFLNLVIIGSTPITLQAQSLHIACGR